MKYTPFGVDIAKHLIQVHFIDEHSGEVVDKQFRGQDFLAFFCNREPCLIGMEARGGSQHLARELTKQGHQVRLLQARFVKAFVMGNKIDVRDARYLDGGTATGKNHRGKNGRTTGEPGVAPYPLITRTMKKITSVSGRIKVWRR